MHVSALRQTVTILRAIRSLGKNGGSGRVVTKMSKFWRVLRVVSCESRLGRNTDAQRRNMDCGAGGQCARQSCGGQSVDSGRHKNVEIRVRRPNLLLSCMRVIEQPSDSVGHAMRSFPRDHTATLGLTAKVLQNFWRVLRVVTGESQRELEQDAHRRTVIPDVRGQCARQSCAGQSVDSGRHKNVEIRVRRPNHSLSCRLATHETPDSVGHATRSVPRDHTATSGFIALQNFCGCCEW
jgi:hypothetical protein